MPQQDINIKIKLTADTERGINAVNSALLKVSNNIKKVNADIKRFSSDIQRIGRSMELAGTAITAPLILAAKTASQYSVSLSQQLERLNNSFTNLQIKIGEALLPVVEKLTNAVTEIVDRFMALDETTRNNIIQGIAWTGVWLIASGIILDIAGKIGILITRIISIGLSFGKIIPYILNAGKALLLFTEAHPVIAIIVTIVSILIVKLNLLGSVIAGILNAIEILFRSIWAIFLYILQAVQLLVDGLTKILAWIVKVGSVLPGVGKQFKQWSDDLFEISLTLEDMANQNFEGVKTQLGKVGKIVAGENGSIAAGAQIAKTEFANLWKEIQKGMKLFDAIFNGKSLGGKSGEKPGGLFSGLLMGIETARKEFADFHKLGVTVGNNIVLSMRNSFSSFFNDFFLGQLKSAKEYFADFGRAILKQFSDVLAQMATNWIIFGNWLGQSQSGGISGGIMGILSSIFGAGGAIAGVGGAISGAATSIGSRVGGVGPGITGSFGGIPTWSPMHTGGLIKAHSGLAVDEVPIIAQSGEGILSRKGMANLAKLNRGDSVGGGVTININPVVQLWDASDIEKNKTILISAISQAITQNRQIRKIIKEYT